MISIPLFLTEEHSCSYLDNQQSQSLFVHPSCTLTTSIYGQLLEQGFRRSGDQVYRPHCQHCCACVPVRVPVETFQLSRNQKRTLQKNQTTQAIIKPAMFEQHHYDMFQRYQQTRHSDSCMAQSSPEDYMHFLSCTWCDTVFVEFSINNDLVAVAIVDQLENAYSAVYTFFDPKFSHFSPGNYAVLWQLQQAKLRHFEYLYLGFWVEKCRKMSYKTQYLPIQIFNTGEWQNLQ